MKRNVIAITSMTSIMDAAILLRDKHIGCLPVIDLEGKILGMVTLQSLLFKAMPDFVHLIQDLDFVKNFGAAEEQHPNKAWLAQPISEIMQEPVFVNENSGLLHTYSILNSHQLHDVPVIDQNRKLVGIVSRVDVGVAFLGYWLSSETEIK